MRRATVALLFALIVLVSGSAPPSAAQAPQSSLRILSREGARALATISLNNQEYVALDDVATTFGLTLVEDRLAGGVTATAGARTIIITPDQPVVSVAGRLVSLTAAPVRQGNRWLLPLDFLQRALGPALDTRMELRRAARLLVVGDVRVPRVTARVDANAGGTTVTVDTTPATPARVTLEGGRVQVVFDADALDFSSPAMPPQDFLQALQQGDTPTSLRLVPGSKFGMHRATTTQPDASSSRLVIDMLPAGTESPAAPVPAPAVPAAPADPLPPSLPLPAAGVRTIVIDAGHGGDELGARGPGGTLEKDVTLAVARRLRTMIEVRLGLRVFLTRDDDRTISLDERSAYANSQKADVFISLHANAAIRPAMKGAEVYYLSIDRADAEARRMAESTGTVLPSLGGGTRSVDLILWEIAQARYLEQSSALAGMVEQSLRARVAMSPRPVQQAPFRVLVGANMPAVLVEIGYLSNAEQEQALGSGAYQDQVTQGLFDALVQFRARIERSQP
ncbi:MAG: N-acetylmuramoyl-L-alanine amidase [Acidobacteria bacterium]|nr:N-acetylmuramoyl-L-alanine amidase [Acidobacteriota bacterium]